MRDVIITEEAGVFSTLYDHPLKLKVGMKQQLIFGDKDNFRNTKPARFGGPRTMYVHLGRTKLKVRKKRCCSLQSFARS